MAHRIRSRVPKSHATPGGNDLTALQASDRDEREALDRLLRYAKREAETQEQWMAARLIEAAIVALAGCLDCRPLH
jgi:hypothetical protein